MKVTRIYSRHEEKIDVRELNVGDSVQIPEFTVPETTVAGDRELHFEEQTVKDTATVYNIKDDKVYLVFDHALFCSAMDLNNATEWKKTQLHNYLSGAFKNSMKDVDIPALEVSLLSKDEVFGRNALPFFKNGRNRIAFIKDESCVVWCWLKNVVPASGLCRAYNLGSAYPYDISYVNFIRPCFTVNTKQQDN